MKIRSFSKFDTGFSHSFTKTELEQLKYDVEHYCRSIHILSNNITVTLDIISEKKESIAYSELKKALSAIGEADSHLKNFKKILLQG